ncbi:MAG: hypothetical protein IJ570_05075 [Prevotella sp.]|nr:hypothetical protein [Prevotella sp.]
MKKVNIWSLVTFCFCLLGALACPAAMQAEVSRDSVPSNYGNWVNLTEGYTEDKGTDHQKMQVEIEGDVIHLCWCELTPTADIRYRIWYRRSPNLGKTWDDAKLVFETQPYCNAHLNINSGGINKLMTVSGQNVHFAVIDENRDVDGDSYGWRKCIRYRRSTDGGATFEDIRTMATTSGGWYGYRSSVIDSDGDMVAIAFSSRTTNSDGYWYIRYYTSKDNGETFQGETQIIAAPSNRAPYFYDFHVSGGRWVSQVVANPDYYWQPRGYLWMTTSDGSTLQQQQIAPLDETGEPYVHAGTLMTGGNGDSYNYHPQMAIDGNTIHVTYRATIYNSDEYKYYYYTLYQNSQDFGQTWNEPVVLPDATGDFGTIAAKGQNVYIYTTNQGRHTIYYSNDGGTTWNSQLAATFDNNRYNPSRSFSLVVDPYDESGQHAWLTGNRYYYAETRDGFKTLSKHFVLGTESFKDQYRSNNYGLEVYPDKNGLEHWFMQYNHPTVVTTGGGYSIEYGSQDIVYRRAEAEPAPSTINMALNLADTLSPQHRVVVPMTQSLRMKEAMTVELWLRPDNNYGWELAAATDCESQQGSQYNGGWYLIQQSKWDGSVYYEGGFCTDDPETTSGTRIYDYNNITIAETGGWHHIALTYDANGGNNNGRLYVDGQLAASATIKGNIVMGRSPICIGRTTSYYASEGLLDNFTIWSRALTDEEIAAHARTVTLPQTTDADCRLLLTFDGTLKDQSQYGNDGVALLDVVLSENPGITPSGISVVTSDRNVPADAVYSIDGRRIGTSTESLPNGIYIVGGKKYISK